MKKEINIFEFPFNLGLTKKEHETEPGVKKLPDWLKKLNFHAQLHPKNVFRLEGPDYAMEFDEETRVKNPDRIIEYAQKQCDLILENYDKNTFSVIIGGDCSILIGTAIALKKDWKFWIVLS